MPTYKTPGVYIEEISIFPPSVAEVSTAIPAFIGYTEKSPTPEVTPSIARIATMLEFETFFGGPNPSRFTFTTERDAQTSARVLKTVERDTKGPEFLLYYSVSLYFKNGGGPCYVVSVGNYTTPEKDHFENGIKELAKEDEPTLIVLTDAVRLGAQGYYDLCRQALQQCKDLGDRFSILDVVGGDIHGFRNDPNLNGRELLMYGAAYHPYLETSLSYEYDDKDVTFAQSWQKAIGGAQGILVIFTGNVQGPPPQVEIIDGNEAKWSFAVADSGDHKLTITLGRDKTGTKGAEDWVNLGDAEPRKSSGFDIVVIGAGSVIIEPIGAPLNKQEDPDFWKRNFGDRGITVTFTGKAPGPPPQVVIEENNEAANWSFAVADSGDPKLTITLGRDKTGTKGAEDWVNLGDAEPRKSSGFNIEVNDLGSGTVEPTTSVALENTLKAIEDTETELYNQIKTRLTRERVILPPSAAMAGIYARVDRDRGVWKAPANVAVSSILGPVKKISDADQENLNVDPTAGKSINAIRAFTGKGTLVWGARTLAGNDNEWRYVSVRRLFNMIEESIQKATAFAVFEPNDATTWLKVKAMIESFLYGLWEQGGLAGPTPDAAYFVNVGLGKTMTTQDILEGRMIVEVGIAAVRPAEFIILRFTHKLQEA